MADEPVMIEATIGEFAGRRLTVPAADAKQAITDGWARDPFAEKAEEAKEMTDEDREKAMAAAEKASRKLRGEPEEENGAQSEAETTDRAMEAEKPGDYQTRAAKTK